MKLRVSGRALAGGAVALVVLAVAGAVVLARGDDRRQRLRQEAARAAVSKIASIEESYHRVHGRYTNNLLYLANMTGDWSGFLQALETTLDLDAGFSLIASSVAYRIEARARDRKRTPFVMEGTAPAPPPKPRKKRAPAAKPPGPMTWGRPR